MRALSVSRAIVFLLAMTLAAAVGAVIETYEFSSLELEQRYHELSQELRCPKCQNQNIADSNAPISRDLRALLHKQLEAGHSDEQILAFMVERYGEFVRYRPAVDEKTAVLWLAPLAMVVSGFLGLGWHLWRRRNRISEHVSQRDVLQQLRDRAESKVGQDKS